MPPCAEQKTSGPHVLRIKRAMVSTAMPIQTTFTPTDGYAP